MSDDLVRMDAEELKNLVYITRTPTDGRTVYLLPYVDSSGRFVLPLILDGRVEVGFAIPVAGPYMAETAQDESTDVSLPLLTTIVRHLSYPDILAAFLKLERDLMNCAAFIEKYFVLHSHYRDRHVSGYGDVLASEYEGALVNARSLYDQLQHVFRVLWKHVIQVDKRPLPKSFADLADLSASQLRDKYRLPPAFVEFVARASAVFTAVRNLRVSIIHSGASQQDFFCLPDGFAVDVTGHPWRVFDLWPSHTVRNARLGSYLLFVASMCRELLSCVAHFESAVLESIPLPEPITSMQVFVRGGVAPHFAKIDEYIRNPWISYEV